MRRRFFTALLLLLANAAFAETPSTCFGTPERGRLEHGWQLPTSGDNFSAYSLVGVTAGRNYVHSTIHQTVVDSYAELNRSHPEIHYVYGETGSAEGGKFSPHKTHQNGLSIDFFVPVTNRKGKSVPLPTGVLNKLGYNIEFDKTGHYQDMSIDFSSMNAHLRALKSAADKNGIKIRRVIFDNELQKLLFKTPGVTGLHEQLTFSTKKPWVRHDEHYHVDFIVACKPL